MSDPVRRSPADYPIPKLTIDGLDLGDPYLKHEGELVLAAARLVSVHKLAGPHDGGVMLNLAVRDLVAALDPWRCD